MTLPPAELEVLALAEQRTERFTADRPAAGWSHRRGLIYLPAWPHPDTEKHAKHCLRYAGAKRVRVTATASRPDAVVAAAEAGLVDVVLCAVRWRGGEHDAIEPVLLGLGVPLAVVRDTPHRVRVSANPVAARLAAMGLTEGQIAEALGVTVEQVHGVVEVASVADRRPGGPIIRGASRAS